MDHAARKNFSATGRLTQCVAGALLALAPFVIQGGTESEESAHRWLAKMAEAIRTLNYDGTFVYRNEDRMESMRIIHRASPGEERERMFSLTGTPREVLRDKNKVTCILPDSQSVVVVKSRPRSVALHVFDPQERFTRFYRLSAHAGERVAGRKTTRVSVQPIDEYRYGYRLWLDQLTGLLLKSELVSEQGKALEQIVYTNIRLPAHIPDDLLAPAISGEGYTWYSNEYPVTRTASIRPGDQWVVTWVPKGFEVSDRIYDPSSVSRNPVEHLVYSDGLAKMSVFIELLDDAKERLLGPSGMGAINAYGSVIGDYQVTVVGEVPEITVEKVGQSVRRR